MGLLRRQSRDPALPLAALPPAQAARLDDPDPACRRRAVQALAASQEPGAHDTLVALLRTESDNAVRQSAFSALTMIGTPEAAQAAAGLLTESDPALRNGALEALGAMQADALALLDQLGCSDDPDVRSFAVMIAADLPGEASGAWLIAQASTEDDPNVCAHLADALGSTELDAAADALDAIAARFAGSAFIAFTVQSALRRLGHF